MNGYRIIQFAYSYANSDYAHPLPLPENFPNTTNTPNELSNHTTEKT